MEFDSTTLVFAGRSNISGVNQNTVNSIVSVITPSYTLENTEIWVYDEDASIDYDASGNHSIYNLIFAAETDIDYVKNLISLSDTWYNQTEGGSNDNKVDLSTELDQSDINYDAY